MSQPNQNIDMEMSQRLAAKVKAKLGQCYHNAYLAALKIPTAQYVEGYVIREGKWPIEHGWLELDGKIIDPTLPEPGNTYFAGLCFNGPLEVVKAMGKSSNLPIFYRFGWGGEDSPEMMAAYKAAWAYLGVER